MSSYGPHLTNLPCSRYSWREHLVSGLLEYSRDIPLRLTHITMEKEENQRKIEKKRLDAMGKEELAIHCYNQWRYGGSTMDKEGNPKLGKAGAVAIVSVLLPKISPGQKVGDYKTMSVCVEWIQNIGGGMTWEIEMDAVNKQHCAAIMSKRSRLF